MPQTIVFDTNYLVSFGATEYRSGGLPQKLHDQVDLVVDRGDLVALPNTVRLETNAWLSKISQRAWDSLNSAHQRLREAGFKIEPDFVEKQADIDILAIFQSRFPEFYLLKPSIEDYNEAERRTSYRLPPRPTKKPDSEEFRDRIIWCQLVSYAQTSEAPVLIVSGDGLFKNGAESEEGRAAGIQVVEGEVDLDQQLNNRPHHIQAIVDQLLMFVAEFQSNGIEIDSDRIVSIEELRTTRETSGSLIHEFTLRTTDIEHLPSLVWATMISFGESPLSLSLTWEGQTVEFSRQISPEAMEEIAAIRFRDELETEQAEKELKALIGS